MSVIHGESVAADVVEPLSVPALIKRLEREVEGAFQHHDWKREWDMERERSYALTMLRHARDPLQALAFLSHLRVSVASRGYGTGTNLGGRLASIATNFVVVADESTAMWVRQRINEQDVW